MFVLEALLGALFQFLGELALQVIGEILVEIGLHSIKEPFRGSPNSWLAAVGYAMFGAGFGGLSLLVMPSHFVASPALRLLNLAVTPVGAGLCMTLVGRLRARRGEALLRIDRFAYGYLFAFTIALIRLVWAH